MNILKHSLLIKLAKLIEQERTALRWIDLYAAQFIADSFTPELISLNNTQVSLQAVSGVSGTADLFDNLPETQAHLSQEDIIVLALMCSQLLSQGKTHLNLKSLPQDLLTSAKACGYRPGYASSQELIDILYKMPQNTVIRFVTLENDSEDNNLVLEDSEIIKPVPLVVFQDRLYLAKYWSLHQGFEAWLRSRVDYVEHLETELLGELSKVLKQVFLLENTHVETQSLNDEVNWQAVSAAHTLLNPFSLITGGPGTGKTTTAASLLFLLMAKRKLQMALHAKDNVPSLQSEKLHVRLLAPTGKAAVKLADSIRQHLLQIEKRLLGNKLTSLKMSDCLPESGETVHRFLYELGGLRDSFQQSKRFRGDQVLAKRSQLSQGDTVQVAKHTLDVVIVDESSMMDLALMVELVSLIPPTTQLILLGDHFQLPAVDPGQVFSECVRRFSKLSQTPTELASLSLLTGYHERQLREPKPQGLQTNTLGFQPLCWLKKTYRFGGTLKIAAEQIKAGEVHSFKKQFWCASDAYQADSAVTWFDFDLDKTTDYQGITNAYKAYFDLVSKRASLTLLAEQFERYQLLCSTLDGPLGVHFLNTFIEQRFHSACFPNGKVLGELYHGKAILVTRNHPHLGIYNGDIGFLIADENHSNLNVQFPVANQEPIIVPPARIKDWQTAYAMTVHKSQGSEYQNVGVVLADYAKELLSRALLYTALTRSKERCDIWAGGESLEKAFQAES